MTPDDLVDYVALELAKIRTHGDVRMDGSHNPLPTERRTAERIVEVIQQYAHVCDWQDTGFADVDECSICGTLRSGAG